MDSRSANPAYFRYYEWDSLFVHQKKYAYEVENIPLVLEKGNQGDERSPTQIFMGGNLESLGSLYRVEEIETLCDTRVLQGLRRADKSEPHCDRPVAWLNESCYDDNIGIRFRPRNRPLTARQLCEALQEKVRAQLQS
jgi:hypothetical protein